MVGLWATWSKKTVRRVTRGLHALPLPWFARRGILSVSECTFGRDAYVGHGFRLMGAKVHIGRDCFINVDCIFDGPGRIAIGEGAYVGPRTTLLANRHPIGGEDRRAGALVASDVTVGAGAWIGAHVVVLGGVSIGRGAIIAAGAIVTRDVPPNEVWGGVPASKIRSIDT